jgi:hypothetical protein
MSFKLPFDLPSGWNPPELLEGVSEIGGLRLEYVGLLCSHSLGAEQAFGSAVTVGRKAYEQASFELLERCAIFDALRSNRVFLTRNAEGVLCGEVELQEAFLPSPRPGVWSYSKSNGVAFELEWRAACRRARRERVERDTILRSWHHRDVPLVKVKEGLDLLSGLEGLFRVESYEFVREDDPSGTRVAGVFLWACSPRATPQACYGFGAHESIAGAVASATREVLQRLAFLWGEDIDPQPKVSPTADFHQEAFLGAGGGENLQQWLKGTRLGKPYSWAKEVDLANERFVDIGPVERGYYVAKSLDARYPLYFGLPSNSEIGWVEPNLVLHPIA